jgi:uncharacterized membrane protein (UPF0127 family)
MKHIFGLAVLLLIISLVFGCKQAQTKEPEQPTAKIDFRNDGTLDIIGKDGKLKTTFVIEIVQNQKEIMQGLKYRETMDDNQGMLFIFPVPDYHDFWMQDTYMPLDIIYCSADERIFQINENAQPFSEERIAPSQPNSFVLEVKAGTAQKMNIQTGDKISWKRN